MQLYFGPGTFQQMYQVLTLCGGRTSVAGYTVCLTGPGAEAVAGVVVEGGGGGGGGGGGLRPHGRPGGTRDRHVAVGMSALYIFMPWPLRYTVVRSALAVGSSRTILCFLIKCPPQRLR